MMLGHKPSLAIVCGVAACSKLSTTRVCGLAACHKLSAPSCLILEYLGVCHMVACHNPSQTIVCCLAACRNPSAPRVCHMAACRNPSAPRVCRLAACHFPPPKLEVGTQLCRLDACHFPPYPFFHEKDHFCYEIERIFLPNSTQNPKLQDKKSHGQKSQGFGKTKQVKNLSIQQYYSTIPKKHKKPRLQ